jgi:hypothetical protein
MSEVTAPWLILIDRQGVNPKHPWLGRRARTAPTQLSFALFENNSFAGAETVVFKATAG